MDDITAHTASVEDTDHERQVDYFIAEMRLLQSQMREDREEILRLQAETRAILDDIMTALKVA